METIPGGVYKDATGDGFHDANGKSVDASKATEASKVERSTLEIFVPPPQRATLVVPALDAPALDAPHESLVTATERRARNRS